MKRIKKIVFVILSIFLALILAFNIYNFISLKVLHKDLATINGYALLEVVSGSMEPTIHKGDMIIINTKSKNYHENDIVTFYGKAQEFITHRIKSIDNKMMITKGDNNNTEDAPVNMNNIVGKYITKIKGAGVILSSFKNPFTMVMIFIIGLFACILLSTDKDGKPLLDSDEKEYQEFLKNKNEIKEESKLETKKAKEKIETKEDTKKEVKKSSSTPKKKTNTSDAKKTSSTKKTANKETSKDKTTPKTASKKTVSATTKVSGTKKEVSKKPSSKKSSTSKKTSAKTTGDKQTSKVSETKRVVAKKSTSKNKK